MLVLLPATRGLVSPSWASAEEKQADKQALGANAGLPRAGCLGEGTEPSQAHEAPRGTEMVVGPLRGPGSQTGERWAQSVRELPPNC